MIRRASRTDANHSAVVDALLAIGCSVQTLSAIGCGCPDLWVARNGRMWAIEVKDGDKPPSERKLTPDQVKWHARWKAPVHVVNSPEEAILVVMAKEAA